MRFAAIADIHGNYAALEAVLADIHGQGITDIVNLGDCLSGPLEAGRTADLLLLLDTMATLTVRGNHDRYLIENPADAMPSWEVHAFSELAPVICNGCASCRSAPSIGMRPISAMRRRNRTTSIGWSRCPAKAMSS